MGGQPLGGKLDYIRAALSDLRNMAADQGDDMLAYLIEMARQECDDITTGRRRRSVCVEAREMR